MKRSRPGLRAVEQNRRTTMRLLPQRKFMSGNMYVIENVECIHETEKALLVEVGNSEHWIAKSMLHPTNAVKRKGDTGTLVLQRFVGQARFGKIESK